jgi:hypothetical protein
MDFRTSSGKEMVMIGIAARLIESWWSGGPHENVRQHLGGSRTSVIEMRRQKQMVEVVKQREVK